MRIAVINMSGGVGKTTLAAYLLRPRMAEDVPFFAVESINRSADDLGVDNVQKFRGRDFGSLYENLMIEDNAIVDVGASNIEAFFDAARRFTGGTQEIDLYLIPTPPDGKYITESIETARKLISLGVAPTQIRFILNRVPREMSDDIKTIYDQLFQFARHQKTTNMVSTHLTIFADPLFEDLASVGLSLEDLLSDEHDYRAMARAEADPEKRKAHTSMRRMISQAGPLKGELDTVYSKLLPAVA